MLRNYLTITLRNLRRKPGYTAVNVVGLTVGLAVCFVIGLYIRHELRFDRFHAHAERIVRIVQAEPAGDAFGPSSVRMLDGSASTPPGLAQALQGRFPHIEQATVVEPVYEKLLGAGDRQLHADHLLRADTAFFDVFSFDLVRGNPASALDAPGQIVVTQSLARRLFGAEDPMGRTVLHDGETPYEVTGVATDPPATSHLQFEALQSLGEEQRETRYGSTVRWNFFSGYVYLMLREGTDPQAFEIAIRDYERTASPDWRDEAQLRLQPLTDVRLYSAQLGGDIAPHGDIRYLYFFGLIGGLILLIACINYVNLATAQAARRAREVGVRKTAGAGRWHLVGQFLGESVLLALLALPLALAATRLALPVVNDLAGTTLHLADLPFIQAVGFSFVFVVLVGVAAGSYPALVLSRFRPAAVLARAGRGTTAGGSPWLRKGLVVFQFAASVALILATLVVVQQLDYMQAKRLGFDQERVITFDKEPLGEQFAAFRNALTQHVAVTSVSAGPPVGIGHKNMARRVGNERTGTAQWAFIMFVDHDYLKTLDLTLKQGRSFTPSRTADVGTSVLLTEAAVAAYDLEGNPVGQTIPWGEEQRTVVGVFEDFHNESLRDPIQPVVLALVPENTSTVLVRLAPGPIDERLDAVRTTWRRFLPDRPFTFTFLDERIEAQYRAEERLATLFGLFAGLAVVVAGLGLLGLAAFTTQQRTQEIGMRKVLGASIASIVGLLSREFVVLVGVAFALAAPLAFWAMERWLQQFAFRVGLGAGLFALVAGVVTVTALAAVGYHAIRAAYTDPARALRTE